MTKQVLEQAVYEEMVKKMRVFPTLKGGKTASYNLKLTAARAALAKTESEVEKINDVFITVTHVYPKDRRLSFRVTSFIKVIDDKIAAVYKYWGDDGVAPNRILDKHIGRAIK